LALAYYQDELYVAITTNEASLLVDNEISIHQLNPSTGEILNS
tara:strand:+ start:570 stop:698 length:129 start_codon:yes stop_codon:yes gene_type:complete